MTRFILIFLVFTSLSYGENWNKKEIQQIQSWLKTDNYDKVLQFIQEEKGNSIQKKNLHVYVSMRRGEKLFKKGEIAKAITDFEKVVELEPKRKAYLWQLGICYYYQKEYKKGYELFEIHQNVNSHDVENAVWHYICLAQAKGIEKAEKKWIDITGDTRIPMKEIYQLFRGKLKVEDVLNTSDATSEKTNKGLQARMYAHLYLGLYYEIHKQGGLAHKHLKLSHQWHEKFTKAVGQSHYMGDVARVHLRLLESSK